MKNYLLVLSILFFSFSAFGKKVVFPKIKITGLSEYVGQKINVYYVAGRPAGIGTIGHKLLTNKIWNSHEGLSIPNSLQVTVPETTIENKYGVAFNYVLVVVYSKNQKNYLIKNADGTCPALADADLYKAREELCNKDLTVFSSIYETYISARNVKLDPDGYIRLKFK